MKSGLELWLDNISFDDLLITDIMALAVAIASKTFDLAAPANLLQWQYVQVLAPKLNFIKVITRQRRI